MQSNDLWYCGRDLLATHLSHVKPRAIEISKSFLQMKTDDRQSKTKCQLMLNVRLRANSGLFIASLMSPILGYSVFRRGLALHAAMSSSVCLALLTSLSSKAAELPPVVDRPPVPTTHFPDTLHAVVWRNWGLVEPERLADVLHTTSERVRDLAVSMGLPRNMPVPKEMHQRGYLTLIRRNWHLLPYEQLVRLLDTTPEQLAFTLREDDVLYVKLGSVKPKCDLVRYSEPSSAARKCASEIRQLVEKYFSEQPMGSLEPRFAFIADLSQPDESRIARRDRMNPALKDGKLRFIYSYFALFGDSLGDSCPDPYPLGLLQRLSDQGVNGIWLHVVLRQLAPGGPNFPEWGDGHERRLAKLRALVEKAKLCGIDVYLYINEPRAMPAGFFADKPEMAGVREDQYTAVCTSNTKVRQWIGDSLTYVFRKVPGLGGVLTITASENLTNCASHGRHTDCPHCKQRSRTEILAEVNSVIEEGVHRADPDAKVIVWDWGWRPWKRSSEFAFEKSADHTPAPTVRDDAGEIVANLPHSVWLMSVSEWSLPIERGGVKSIVGEYSLAAIGPGPRANRLWQLAHKHGLKTAAKVQLNASWELSSVPYLPVMDLVAENCSRLAQADVNGLMLSWSVGGYPSVNLELANRFFQRPTPTVETVLQDIAERHYGTTAAPYVRDAWTRFSRAFQEFPFHIQILYRGPQQLGPANLLFAAPTGFAAGVLVSPFDDLKAWCGPYSPEILARQFHKLSEGWAQGLESLSRAQAFVPDGLRARAAADLRVAQAVQIHFASTANQSEFILARDKFNGAQDLAEKQMLRKEVIALLDREIELASRLYELALADSRIGYEASNQYYYVPNDLIEKIINCIQLRKSFTKIE